MSLANKQTFNLISSLTICQIMLIHNNVFMNKLVSMKLYFNYIYIYMRQSIYFFFIFSPSIQNFFYGFVYGFYYQKKQRMRYYCCRPLDFAILIQLLHTYKQLVHVPVFSHFGGELEGLPRVNHEINENLGLKFLTNIFRPSQRIILVITRCSGVGRRPKPTPLPPRHPTFLKYILLCLIFLNGLSYF